MRFSGIKILGIHGGGRDGTSTIIGTIWLVYSSVVWAQFGADNVMGCTITTLIGILMEYCYVCLVDKSIGGVILESGRGRVACKCSVSSERISNVGMS